MRKEGGPFISNEDDDELLSTHSSAEAPAHIGELMHKMLRPPESPPEAPEIAHESDDDDDEELESSSSYRKRSKRFARSLRGIIEPKDATAASGVEQPGDISNDVTSTTDFAHDFVLDMSHDETPGQSDFPERVDEGYPDVPYEAGEPPVTEGSERSTEPLENDQEQVEGPQYNESELPERPADDVDLATPEQYNPAEDTTETDKNVPVPPPNRPPTPPTPPVVPPNPNSGGSGGNFYPPNPSPNIIPPVPPAPHPSPNNLNLAPQAPRREVWGPVAFVTALGVHFASRRRDKRMERRQHKKNRELESMISKKADKTNPELSRPQPARSVAERPQLPETTHTVTKVEQRVVEQQPVPPTVNERVIMSPAFSKVEQPKAINHKEEAPVIKETVVIKEAVEQSPRVQTENTQTRTEHFMSKEYAEKNSDHHFELPHADRIEMPESSKEKGKIPELRFDERHEIMDSGNKADIDPLATKTVDSQPVTHISHVLAESKHVNHVDTHEYMTPPVLSSHGTDLNKQYVRTGFFIGIVIVIGVILVVTLR